MYIFSLNVSVTLPKVYFNCFLNKWIFELRYLNNLKNDYLDILLIIKISSFFSLKALITNMNIVLSFQSQHCER